MSQLFGENDCEINAFWPHGRIDEEPLYLRENMALTPTTSIALGFDAPAFELPDAISGQQLNADDLFDGGPTVVIFMCNHCPFVIHLLDELVSLAEAYQARGVNFIGISSNDVESYPQDSFRNMKALADSYNMPFPYLYDESQDVARAYDAACTPDFSVYDQAAKCVYRGQYDGSRPGNDMDVSGDDLRRVVNMLLMGDDVPMAGQVPSVGCNIKWKG